jgi:ubiquinone/menaquinone biosynthesis C-methylase UbiE
VYERARPEYPAEAIAWITRELDLREGRTVADLGAGTGKLTRALIATGARVIAVEPGDAMLAELHRVLPGVAALRGAAEAIPLADESVDAITAGSAFHWFRHEEALPELHRVLRPGGALGVLWNSRDHERPLQQRVVDRIASVSFVAAAPEEARVELERKLREAVAAQGGTVDFAYVTEGYVSRAA